MANPPEPLTEAQLREINQLYKSFQSVAMWATAEVETTLWDTTLEDLQADRSEVSAEAFDELREETLRQAAIDTGAIEQLYATDRGFTITVAAMATAWEAEIVAQKGVDVARMVMGHKQAYDLALDVAVGAQPITEALVRRLHEEACAGQVFYEVRTPLGPQLHPLPKGEYKHHPNHVELADGSYHAYAPIEVVSDEMHRLVSTLSSREFATAHPVTQAAWAHHSFATIHPFADGNGRVARVLASIFLLRASSLPFVLFADQRLPYLSALEATDKGQIDVFIRFVRDRSLDTMLYVSEALRTRTKPQATERLRAAAEQRNRDPSRTALQRLRGVLSEEIDEQSRDLNGSDLPASIGRSFTAVVPRPPTGYRIVAANRDVITLVASTDDVSAYSTVAIITPTSPREFEFDVWSVETDRFLPARRSDVVPEITTQFRLRLRVWLTGILDDLLNRLGELLEGKGD